MGSFRRPTMLFAGMTVRENLEMGAFLRRMISNRPLTKCMSCFPAVADKRNQLAGELIGRSAPTGGRGPRPDDAAHRADAG